jgi:hypothetical protein
VAHRVQCLTLALHEDQAALSGSGIGIPRGLGRGGSGLREIRVRGGGDQQLECRAVPDGALQPDRAVVGFGDRRRDRQAEPERAGLAAPVTGAGEPAEEPFQVRSGDAAAGVRDGKDGVRRGTWVYYRVNPQVMARMSAVLVSQPFPISVLSSIVD